MPNIPTPGNTVQAGIARSNAPGFSTNVDPDAFGAQVGNAVQRLGLAIGDVGGAAMDFMERKNKEKVANAVAKADFTPEEVKLRGEVGPDAVGYRDRALTRYDEWVEEQANGLDDDVARMEFRRRMAAERPTVSSRAAIYEEQQGITASKTAADASLFSLENQLVLDPLKYDKALTNGYEVIDARPGLNATQRQVMREQWRMNAANARFTGLLENASSVAELDAIAAELSNADGKKDWASEFDPAQFEQTVNAIQVSRKSFYEKANSDARAAIDTLNDRNTALSRIPDDELRDVAAVVKGSNDPILIKRFMRIQRDQQYVRTYSGKPPADIQLAIQNAGGTNYPNMPPEVSTGINNATARFDVSASFLGALINREYGSLLQSGDYGIKASTSSATGITQFLDSTFLEIMQDGRTPQRMGVDIAGMSREQILDLRKDPNIAAMAGAAYAEQNKVYLQKMLGRPVNDTELYMAHFLGRGGALKMLQGMATNPKQSAAQLAPEAAAANHNVFYKKGMDAYTVEELYNNIGRTFASDPDAVAFGDVQTLQNMQAETEKALRDDPMGFVQQTGQFDVQPLTDAAAFAARGATARAAADYYSIPMQDFKPLTATEAQDFTKQINDGDSDAVLDALSSISQMGTEPARAAFKQIGQTDTVYGYAGRLGLEAGGAVAATEVVRGQKKLEDNPAVRDSIGTKSEIDEMFSRVTKASLFGIAPADRQAVQDAALAHYAETYTARGKAGLDETAFRASINAVLGGQDERIGEVNGTPVLLPEGVNAETLNRALDRMSDDDWIRLSAQKMAPMFLSGERATAIELANEAKLIAIGGGKYQVGVDDGSLLITGRFDAAGRPEAYLFTPTAEALASVGTVSGASPTEVPFDPMATPPQTPSAPATPAVPQTPSAPAAPTSAVPFDPMAVPEQIAPAAPQQAPFETPTPTPGIWPAFQQSNE